MILTDWKTNTVVIAGFKNGINSRSLAITSKIGAIPCPQDPMSALLSKRLELFLFFYYLHA
jgi:hypothetical protein